jgi:hypothetical protein
MSDWLAICDWRLAIEDRTLSNPTVLSTTYRDSPVTK